MRILLCDDHVLLAEAMQSLLRAAGHSVSVAHCPRDALDSVAEVKPDVCVMDIGFPGADGLQAVARLRDSAPDTRVLVLSAIADAQTIATAVELGAAGYMCKDMGVADIVRAIERVHDGETVLAPHVLRTLTRRSEVRSDDIHWLVSFLTQREREVLRRIVIGQSTVEMARDMGITRSTARTHVQNLLQKLGVHSRLEAVAAVSRAGGPDLSRFTSTDGGHLRQMR